MRFRYSGHETFQCRYAWLPKAYAATRENPTIFADENEAMVRLGIGKNMVRSLRFWAQVAGVIESSSEKAGYNVTSFGESIFGQEGLDPYLEDIKTLWLIHWKLMAHFEEPLFAWYFLLNEWTGSELSHSEILKAFEVEIQRQERTLSKATLEQHLDMFFHTYLPTKSRKGEVVEDNLDCPLTELRLITYAGERDNKDTGRREPIYTFRKDRKPEISGSLLAYCLYDYWRLNKPNELTLSFRETAIFPNSIGQVFKLTELDLRERLEEIYLDSNGLFEYQASAAVPRIVRNFTPNEEVEKILLKRIYE